MIKKFITAFIFILLGTGYSNAFPTQGGFIYDLCERGIKAIDRVYLEGELWGMPGNTVDGNMAVYCAAYIMAAEDDLSEKGSICPPTNSPKISIKAVVEYFEKHPELKKKNARIAVDAAIKAKYPCP
ncbi:Rap1a/Tai family immunity protein [uncultured Kiloniella sp.]|uniref:Rap1a/Tai family immunity protein n=1 Tax=uncultured Kiloniella sp. TaxID=1133091 RepID=UPI002622ADCE|nr:Rap1a/Tai family immunity protein [uncultured Kiloniella sp.]